MPRSSYRPDIDGLRALAVLSVILFHAGLFFPGGFVGVDVFFVISGYLITQIVERDLMARRFSVVVFYQRRVRRIFPALFAMFAVLTILGYLIFPPSELEDFGKTLLAASAFSSNILFFRRSGYFDPNSDLAPLLHTWTLSLEEQFYVGWPLLLVLLNRPWASKWKLPVVVSVLFASVLLAAHLVNTNFNAAFYLLPSRAWELALGALLSLPVISPMMARLPRRPASVASLAGVVMLGIAVFAYDALTPFPGFAALLPCVGAALVIAAGEGGPSLGGRLLALKPLVWTGLISYSLYLWHWPILVVGQLLFRHLSAVERGGLVVLTFLVSWLSWQFVESPFRKGHVDRFGSRNWVIAGLAISVIFVAIGGTLVLRGGVPSRGPDVASWTKGLEAEEGAFEGSPCLARGIALPGAEGCLLGVPSRDSHYEVVLWGDSHAAQIAPALNDIGRRLGLTTRQITKAGCPPLPGARFVPANEMREGCPAYNVAALRTILAEKRVRVVVIADRWDALVSGRVLVSSDGSRPSVRDSRKIFVGALRKLLKQLIDDGRQVVLIGQVPLPPSDLIDCLNRAKFNGWDNSACAADPARACAQTELNVNKALLEASSSLGPRVRIVHPFGSLCGNQGCKVQADGQMLYMDAEHLAYSGARLLEASLEGSIAAALAGTTGQ